LPLLIKDSLKTKIDFSSQNIFAIIYCPKQFKERLQDATEELVLFYNNFGKVVKVGKG